MTATPFSHILGQPRATALMQSALQSGRIAHAYLITGPAQTGKRTLVEAFAGELLGMPTEKAADWRAWKPEGKAGTIKMDQVRDLIAQCATPPLGDKHQVFTVFGAEAMGRDSGHALLKTLEEPPPRTVLILVAERLEAVLPTIRSRTQLIPTFLVDETVIRQALLDRGIPADQAESLASMAEGRIGWAIRQAEGEWTEPFWPEGDWRTPQGRLEVAKAFGDLPAPELKAALSERIRTRWQTARGEVGWDELAALERAVQRLDSNVNAKLVIESLLDESMLR